MLESVNHLRDNLTAPGIRLIGGVCSSFKVCGYTGVTLAVLLGLSLAAARDLSLLLMAGLILTSVMTFFALAMATKIVTGTEQLIYYHHEIAILAVAAVALRLLQQPVLAYLDVIILGVGMFLTCGRVGCLMVGCCHGRPYRWGVRYRPEHAAAGFPASLVGVRLFPIQAVESFAVLTTVIVGSALFVNGAAPGVALAWYFIAYGLVRFLLEFARGDADRPYFAGFSEAQWTTLILMAGLVGAEWAGTLPFQVGHTVATAGLVVVTIAVAVHRRLRRTPTHLLLRAKHIQEVAEAIDQAYDAPSDSNSPTDSARHPAEVRVARTSLGIRISAGIAEDAGGRLHHYTLSSTGVVIDAERARVLARLIVALRHADSVGEILATRGGSFHLVVHEPTGEALRLDDRRRGSPPERLRRAVQTPPVLSPAESTTPLP